MSEWKKVKLKDCCHSISDGDHLPPPKSDSGIPFVTIANIDATNHIDFGNTMFVPYEYYNNLNDIRKAKFNDILYSVVGSFGKPVLIKENKPFAFQRHIAILRPNNGIVDSRFLYYVMLSRDFYMQADTVAIGAAQRTISLTALRNMEVELPSMEIQRRIATILSRYDSLIENYQKQIKLLEEAAQRLYKEWFVDLHFPGHENTNIIDGIPEGWEMKKVGDIAIISAGGDKPDVVTEEQTTECQVPIYSNGTTKEGLYGYTNKSSNTAGSITVSARGSIGFACLRMHDYFSIVRLISIKPQNNVDLMYLFQFTKVHTFMSNGAAQQQLTVPMVKAIDVVYPAESLLEAFENVVLPLYKKVQSLQSQLRLLTEARDRLLPKLMSGEITV